MNKPFLNILPILVTIFSCVVTVQSLACVSLSNVQDSTQQDSLYAPFSNRAGAALSLSISEISFGIPTLMFTSFYQYQFSSLLALEISGNMLQGVSSKMYSDLRTERTSASSTRLVPENIEINSVAHSLGGNVAIVLLPMDDKHFQIGLGASFRWAGLISSSITTRLDSLSQIIRITDTQQFALGANAHCEYIFPLAGNVDLGVRLHSQFFLPPFAVVGQREPTGYITGRMTTAGAVVTFPPAFYGLNGGCGVFLRIGF
jgi:hypothetical protein